MKQLLFFTGGFAVLGLGLLLAEINVDYNHSADFGSLKTYSWLKADAGNPLWADRIREAVDRELTAKGLTMQPNGGDMAVAAFGRTKEELTYNTFYDTLGGGWFWHGFGTTATTTVQQTPVGTLTVDLFDGNSKKLIWRGVATKTLSEKPEKNEKKLNDAVGGLFKKFPPSKGE